VEEKGFANAILAQSKLNRLLAGAL
jgi:hypothetical protein